MKRRMAIAAILIVLLMVTAGCWNRRELNDMGIAVGMGIDKSEDQYRVTIQMVNPGEVASNKGGGGTGIPVNTFEAEGETVFEALRKLTTTAPRKIYLSHLRMVIFGESFAREGISPALDFMTRDHEMRTDFFIAIAKGTTAEEVLKILTPIEKIPTNQMFSALETSEKSWAPSTSVTLHDLISDIDSDGKHPNITGIEIKGDKMTGETKNNLEEIEPPAFLKYAGLAVLKKDQLMDWLNEEESKGYNYVDNNVRSTIISLSCPQGGKLSVELIRTNSIIIGKVNNGKPLVEVRVNTEANVGEVQCKNFDLEKTQSIYDLETELKTDIKEKIESVLKKSKEMGIDIFGFGEAIYRTDSKYWKEVKKNWDQEFKNLPVNIIVEAKIRRIGTVGNSFRQE